MVKKTESGEWKDISIECGGSVVYGGYRIDAKDWMTVRMIGGGSKSARGGPAAEGVARLILGELFAESNRNR